MPSADLLLTNAHLITLDDSHPRASAMAIKDGKILSIGSDSELRQYSAIRHINLQNKTVLPGFIDSHIHLYAYGEMLLRQADLVASQSIDEVLSRLRALQSRRPTGWLVGHGFDNDKLREKKFPTRSDLDKISKSQPIIISRICGHAIVANSAAIALLSSEERAAGDPISGLYTENA